MYYTNLIIEQRADPRVLKISKKSPIESYLAKNMYHAYYCNKGWAFKHLLKGIPNFTAAKRDEFIKTLQLKLSNLSNENLYEFIAYSLKDDPNFLDFENS